MRTKYYTYKIVKEEWGTGIRAKRTRTLHSYEPLNVGGYYFHLGSGLPGGYRILALIKEEDLND